MSQRRVLAAALAAAAFMVATPAAALNGGWSRDPAHCAPARLGMRTVAVRLCRMSATTTTTTRPLPPAGALAAADLFVRLNAERAGRHLAPLRWDHTLATSATTWSARI